MSCLRSRSARSVACCGAYCGSSRQSPILFWRGRAGDDATNFAPNTPIIASVSFHYTNCGCNTKGNLYMQMRDELGSLYTNDMFADLYPKDGQPAVQPWRLALVTVMQFAENLTDRQAADAVRDRMAWK